MAKTKSTSRRVRPRRQDSPHDALFYGTFSVPKHAASALKTILPQALSRQIRWETMRKAPDTFVNPKLSKRYSDVLFEVEIDEENAFIYILYEHKSAADTWTLLQLLDYMVRIWQDHLRKQAPRRKRDEAAKDSYRLPVILPVVLYHGSTGWTVPQQFDEYFGRTSSLLRKYVVNFEVLLDNVGGEPPEQLLERELTPELKLILLALLLGRTPAQFFAELEKRPEILADVRRRPEEGVVFSMLIVYLERAARMPQEEIVMALQDVLKLDPAEQILFAREYLTARAMERGRIEGKLEERIDVLSQLIEQRFGALPESARKRLEAATATELNAMTLRVLNAASIDEVLGKPKRAQKSKTVR